MAKSIRAEISQTVREAGGATLTKASRSASLHHFVDTLRNELNIQLKSFENLKTSQIAAYIEHEKAEGKSDRSLQNDMAHVRAALCVMDREQFAQSEQIGNKALGISGASRAGTHQSLDAVEYSEALAAAKVRDPGFASAMQLQRELGLRAREVVQSGPSLERWAKTLEHGGDHLRIEHGTKGGLSRMTGVIDRERVLAAVREAIAVSNANDGHLIPSQSLEGAMRTYGRHCEAVGLKGAHASHALRCSYAKDRYAQHLAVFGDRRQALAETSLDLGHGDGRGTYVAQVYLR